MTSGERLTLTYTNRSNLALKVDVYPFTSKTPPTSSASSFPPQLPFILYLHSSATNPFFSGSKRDIPPWLLSLCSQKGWPLLCPDYRLAPEASVVETVEDIKEVWKFITDQAGLNWCLDSAGAGSEVDTGSVDLNEGFVRLQHSNGVDPMRGCVVASGASAHLAAVAVGQLDPRPAAVVLTTPILDPNAQFYNTPRPVIPTTHPSRKRSQRIQAVLSRVGAVQDAIVAASDRAQTVDAAQSLTSAWPWRRLRTNTHADKEEHKAAKERAGVYEAVLRSGRLAAVLQPEVALHDVLARHNAPYPPTLLLSAADDQYADPLGHTAFLQLLRKAHPEGAALDDLLDAGLQRKQRLTTAPVQHELFEPSRRIILRIVPTPAQHAFHARCQRQDERYAGEFDAIEAFLQTWISYAPNASPHSSSSSNINTQRRQRRRHEKL